MPDPLSHIRRPDLPWRASRMTECGRLLTDVAAAISRLEALALVKKHGKQRAAFLMCMTCISTTNVKGGDDLVSALAREFFGNRDPQLGEELIALQALVSAHREEFEGFLEDLRLTTDLSAHRRRRTAGGRS